MQGDLDENGKFIGATSKSQLKDPKEALRALYNCTIGLFCTASTYIIVQFYVLSLAIIIVVNTGDCMANNEDSYGWVHKNTSTNEIIRDKMTRSDCLALSSSTTATSILVVTPKTVFLYSLLLTVMRALTFLSGKCVGMVSDYVGRKPLMLGATAGCALACRILICFSIFPFC